MRIINDYLLIAFFFLLAPFYAFSDTAKDLSIIRNNFHRLYCTTSDSNLMKYLIDNQPGYDVSDRVVVELQQRVPYSYDRIEAYLSKICHDGSWSDIDYYDEQAAINAQSQMKGLDGFQDYTVNVFLNL